MQQADEKIYTCMILAGGVVFCCDALSSKIDEEEQVMMQVHLSQEGGLATSGALDDI